MRPSQAPSYSTSLRPKLDRIGDSLAPALGLARALKRWSSEHEPLWRRPATPVPCEPLLSSKPWGRVNAELIKNRSRVVAGPFLKNLAVYEPVHVHGVPAHPATGRWDPKKVPL